MFIKYGTTYFTFSVQIYGLKSLGLSSNFT